MELVRGTDPKSVGPYRILGLLGAGGMGRVYLGVDKAGHRAAVKVINAELIRDREFRERFTREATATAKVRGRFIAGIVASDLSARRPWLATDYVDGPALSDLVAGRGPLTPADAQGMAAGLAEALHTIHGAGVVHRDVKPANVLLAATGPHLIDFGIARDATASTITRTGIVVGTPPYMAPEQIRGKRQVGPPADVFALGGVLTYALTGRHPFGEGDPTALAYRIAHEEPDLDGVADEIIRVLIMACLAKEPGERPSAPELRERLGDVITRPIGAGGRPIVGGAGEDADGAARAGEASEGAADRAAGAGAGGPTGARGGGSAIALVADAVQSQDVAKHPNVSGSPAGANRRRLATSAVATVALVVAGAGILGADLTPGSEPSAGHARTASSISDSPFEPTSSLAAPALSDTPGSALPGSAAPHSNPVPSPANPRGQSQPQPLSTTGPPEAVTSDQPGTVAGISHAPVTSHSSTPPPRPHPSSQPVKPPPPSTTPPPPRPTAPQAPGDAKVSVGMDSGYNNYIVTFSWAPVPGATRYDVHFTFTDGDSHRVTTDEIDSVSGTSYQAPEYSDPSSLACFVVRAVNANGVSDWDSASPHCG